MPNWKRLRAGGVHGTPAILRPDPLSDRLDDARDRSRTRRPSRPRFPGGRPRDGTEGADLGPLARRAGDLERRIGESGLTVGVVGLVGDASGGRGQGLLRLGPREPDSVRGAAEAGRRVSAGALRGRRADRRARRPSSRPRSWPRFVAMPAGRDSPPSARASRAFRMISSCSRPHDRRDASRVPDRPRALRPQPSGSDDALPRGHRRHRPSLRVRGPAADATACRTTISPGIAAPSTSTTRSWTGSLGQWMRRAEEDGATLIVNSDHGFKWGERSVLRERIPRPGDGGILAPPRRRLRGLGRPGEDESRERSRDRVRRRADRGGAARSSGRQALDGKSDPRRVSRPRRRRLARISRRVAVRRLAADRDVREGSE